MKLNFFNWFPKEDLTKDGVSPIPLVFLHGMGGTGQIWRPIAAQLEEQFSCIAPDQRGHGMSRPVPESEAHQFHASDYARDVSLLLQSLNIERYFLIGHSMGVRTALALAHLEPKKVAGLIAVDIGITSAWGGGIGIPLASFLEKLPRSFASRVELKDYCMAHCPDPAIAQYLTAVSKKVSETPESWVFPFDHESLVETIRQANEAPIEFWLREILAAGVPTSFLRGTRSQVWLKPDYEEQRSRIEHPLLEFQEWQDCGHGLPFEQRAKFVEFIRSKQITHFTP